MVLPERINGLTPRGDGHAFVFYGDACSGVPGAPHEATLAATNAAVAAVAPAPEFVIFAGDEIIGLTADEAELRAQWRYWLDHEMRWLDRAKTPIYHTTSNHTTYNRMSERVFVDVLDHLPRNGPPTQQGLTYFVRRDDLLLVFVNTCTTELGGEGFVELEWLAEVLEQHRDAAHTFVVGHHPIHAVNGLAGEHQREVGQQIGRQFWDILMRHGVDAYLCSHILAFDVQVHGGVLQILSAGAGTAYRMPPETEYLHFVQAAIDDQGLRYEVIDQDGQVRERLAWPPQLPPSELWTPIEGVLPEAPAVVGDPDGVCESGGVGDSGGGLLAVRFRGVTVGDGDGDGDGVGDGSPQTLIAAADGETAALPALWVGLTGTTQRLTVTISQAPGRSPHYWFGPTLASGVPFDLQLLLHRDMGPGGLLYRLADDQPWSSMRSASPWGLEVLPFPTRWSVGRVGTSDGALSAEAESSPFRGSDLSISWHHKEPGT